jgi:hypothetical protein
MNELDVVRFRCNSLSNLGSGSSRFRSGYQIEEIKRLGRMI